MKIQADSIRGCGAFLLAVACLVAVAPFCRAQGDVANPTPQSAPVVSVAPELVTRIIPLRYGDPAAIAQLLGSMGARSMPSDMPRALVVTGLEKDVQTVQEAVAQLDVPPPPVRNVEIMLYLVVVSKDDSLSNIPACPPALDGVKTQLTEQFGYTQFGLLESVLLRGRDGESIEASGLLPPLPEEDSPAAEQASYRFAVDSVSVGSGPDGAPMISLDALRCGTEFNAGGGVPAPVPPGQIPRPGRPVSRMETGLSASLDLREGEVAVVGKASVTPGGQGIFVLLSARVLGG